MARLHAPLPPALRPPPDRPGTSGPAKPAAPLDQAKAAGISAVDWVDERTSLSGGLRWTMFRKVPVSYTHLTLPTN